MLSRAALVPRLCLVCRSGLAPSRAAVLGARTSPAYTNWIRWRSHASNPIIQSKERIEALISGKLDESSKKRSGASKRGRGQGRKGQRRKKETNDDEDLPDWGLPTRNDAKSTAAIIETRMFQSIPETLVEEAKIEEQPEEQDQQSMQNEQQPAEEPLEPLEQEKIEPKNVERSEAFRDELLHHQSLGVDALGKPIEALIIKNPNKMRRSKKSVRTVEGEALTMPTLDLHWESIIRTEDQTPEESLTEVMNNIDEMRPSETTVLRMTDFDKLAVALMDGFTQYQLLSYYNYKRGEAHHNAGEMPKYSWVVKQGYWQAGRPNHWGDVKPKQQQAVAIMQTIWNLEVQEQVEGLGRIPIWIQPDIFRLLAQSSTSVLETVKAEFLDESNKERIMSSVDESRITMYARKSIIPVILTRLDEIVQSIATQTVSIRNVQQEDLLPSVLEELGRITRTVVKHNTSDATLDITWLADTDRPPPSVIASGETTTQTETPADIALRLLMGRQQKTHGKVHIVAPSQAVKAKSGSFVAHERETRSMSWRDRLSSWSRYVSPIGEEPITASSKAKLLSQVLSPVTTTPEVEQDEASIRTTAIFGHVLHSKHESRETGMAKHRRILSPVVPHPASFTSITAEDKAVVQNTTIVLKFAPTEHYAANESDGSVPEVQLRLPVDPDIDLSNFSVPQNSTLHGIAPWHAHDVLLPDESVDVRLVQQRLMPLDVNQQSLKTFLAVSEFNLLEGRLRTPTHTQFSIPTNWLSLTQSSGNDAAVDVPHRFMGLEIHQTVETEWQGHTLRYNSIEAGQHGGQRQELTIQQGHLRNGDAATDMANFLALVEEFATGKHFSWHNGHELMQERSDEEFTLDLMDNEFRGDDVLAQDAEERHVSPSSIYDQAEAAGSPDDDGLWYDDQALHSIAVEGAVPQQSSDILAGDSIPEELELPEASLHLENAASASIAHSTNPTSTHSEIASVFTSEEEDYTTPPPPPPSSSSSSSSSTPNSSSKP